MLQVTYFQPTLLAQSDARLTSDQEVAGSIHAFNPSRVWQHSLLETDATIFFRLILSLPLIQEGQLSVSGEITGTRTIELLGGLSLTQKRKPTKSVVR